MRFTIRVRLAACLVVVLATVACGAGSNVGTIASEQPDNQQPSVTPAVTPTHTSPTASPNVPSTEPNCSAYKDDDGRALSACPSEGTVGTQVTLKGQNCRLGDEQTYLVFEGDGKNGTEGADDSPPLGRVDTREDGSFEVAYTIPETIAPIQGSGGGKLSPGTYKFVSRPPNCSVKFVVAAD